MSATSWRGEGDVGGYQGCFENARASIGSGQPRPAGVGCGGARRLLLRSLLRSTGTRVARAAVRATVAHRLTDPNMTDAEKARIAGGSPRAALAQSMTTGPLAVTSTLSGCRSRCRSRSQPPRHWEIPPMPRSHGAAHGGWRARAGTHRGQLSDHCVEHRRAGRSPRSPRQRHGPGARGTPCRGHRPSPPPLGRASGRPSPASAPCPHRGEDPRRWRQSPWPHGVGTTPPRGGGERAGPGRHARHRPSRTTQDPRRDGIARRAVRQ